MITRGVFFIFFIATIFFYNVCTGANVCSSSDNFQCADQKACIHKTWRCDGEEDCKDGSDEQNCKQKKCADGEFTCKNNKCIPNSEHCDSTDQCGDNSDEVDCPVSLSYPCIQPGTYMCSASHLCVTKSMLCNKVRDCPMGDDEPSSCYVNECLDHNGGCSQFCIDDIIGYTCACRAGYKLDTDQKTCIDIDECKSYGRCDQKCQNTVGSYKCSCDKSYNLQSDGKSCLVKGDRPTLVIANLVDISQYSLDGKDSRLVYGNMIGRSLAADVNPHDGYLYWADYVKKTIARTPMNDAKKFVVVANDNLTHAEGIAVDWVGEKLYWTNSGKKSIEVSNTDGTRRKSLFDLGLDMPRGIALLPSKRLMFWSDWGNSPKIERASMDGTDRRTVIGSAHVKWPNSVAVDQVLNRLYWIDSGKRYIGSSDLDGKDLRKILFSHTRESFGLAVFEGFVYWTQKRGEVFAANKFDGKSRQKITGAYYSPYSISINHPLAKPEGANPCGDDNGGCDNLCLLSATNENGFACV